MGERSDEDCYEAFGDECREDVRVILGLADDDSFQDFWTKLREECLKVRRSIKTSPNGFRLARFDMSLTQRITWLQRNVLHPVDRLESALADENRPNFVHWEDMLQKRRGPYLPDDLDAISSGLVELKEQVRDLVYSLQTEKDQNIKTTDEIRYYIVYNAIWDLHEYFPDFPLSRGSWDPEHKQVGILPDYVRRVFLETTGEHERLDGPIKLALEDVRKSQRKTT
ncbi:hypothetical protein [Sulfitobacter sp. M368]|uniref:hypothetical protein n=1 Tax=Sulfitobacter sp. M368 TaxID=2867021 RepID=UPI0021A8D546|nr:hypothetical protein [Sulfitobacter sp. M368]UWR16308.1 hypothetical protein K3754_05320 [Sulfitobacter sp. M368]